VDSGGDQERGVPNGARSRLAPKGENARDSSHQKKECEGEKREHEQLHSIASDT
jgi:hypothetical protein